MCGYIFPVDHGFNRALAETTFWNVDQDRVIFEHQVFLAGLCILIIMPSTSSV